MTQKNVCPVMTKFQNHPSCVAIRSLLDEKCTFSFKKIVKGKMIKDGKRLDVKNGLSSSDISTKIIKRTSSHVLLSKILTNA